MRERFVFCLAVAACCLTGSAVMAESIGTCELTGYTFMGGGGVYTSPAKDYLLTSNADKSGSMWGFGWLKFDGLPVSAVDEAWLSLETYGVGGMVTSPSAANPLDVAVQAVNADVAGITAGNVADFKDNNIIDGSVATSTITEPGIYCWDITSLVNEWIDTGVNNGLVLTGWDSNTGVTLHSYFGGLPDGGANASLAPTLSTTPVPEPSTVAMIAGLAILGLGGVFCKRSLLGWRWKT